MIGGRGWAEPFKHACQRYAAKSGSSGKMDPILWEPYVCRTLGLSPADLDRISLPRIGAHLGYAEGLELAKWVAQNPAPNYGESNG